MPEDYKELVQEIEEFNDAQKHKLLTSYLSEDIKRLGRQVQVKLLEDYLDWLAENNIIGKGSELHKERYIERFLDERNKKWLRKNF